MNTVQSLLRHRSLVLALALVCLVVAPPAHALGEETLPSAQSPESVESGDGTAADSAGPTGPTDETTSPAPGPESQTSSSSSKPDYRGIAGAFLGLILIAVIGLFAYLAYAQNRFFDTVRFAIRRVGAVPEAVEVPTFSGAASLAAEGGEAVDLTISGPAVLTIGEAATFTAKVGEEGFSANWSVEPSEGITPSSATGESISLTASKLGVFTLTAESAVAGKTGHYAVQVSAVAAPGKAPTLPLVGQGYGSALIAILSVAAVVVLGLAEVLKGEAIAAFLGAMLGYAFVKGAQSGGAAADGSDPASTTPPS